MGQHFATESAATRARGASVPSEEALRVRAHVIPKTCELARRLQCTVYVRGVITNREVLQNLGLIYREFGVACLARCLWVVMTRKSTTFLEVVLPRR
jgi:hypothetical protein